MKGKFITFEGCEGCGKSTQIRLITSWLDFLGADYILTREPGGKKISEAIRTVLLSGENDGMDDRCEALLYAAARVQHVKDTILPALNGGKMVLCDRYIDSSLAYQGFARGLGEDYIKEINGYVMDICMPDHTFFLNLSPKEAFERKHGADLKDRMEAAGMEFHEKVYKGYLSLSDEYPRIHKVDCRGEKGETQKNIRDMFLRFGIV